ncbi:MAG: 3-methyl-2-oxobutanoate hydroxymethyltransferase [Pseudomonadota bacterium]
MSAHKPGKSISINTLQAMKRNGEKFTCVAAYDATFASTLSAAGVHSILVGDSLGMVLQGHDSTLPVTIEDIAYHTQCVKRGTSSAFIIADMPFLTYANEEDALANGKTLMQAGAQMLKLEGSRWLAPIINKLTEQGVPVCAHLGLTPQSVNLIGGYRVQGRDEKKASEMLDAALEAQHAGARMLLLECVPNDLAKRITEALDIPVIGIGAGSDTDAQVLVLHDMLGLNPFPARFVKNFLQGENRSIFDALHAYVTEVADGTFPAPEHSFE